MRSAYIGSYFVTYKQSFLSLSISVCSMFHMISLVSFPLKKIHRKNLILSMILFHLILSFHGVVYANGSPGNNKSQNTPKSEVTIRKKPLNLADSVERKMVASIKNSFETPSAKYSKRLLAGLHGTDKERILQQTCESLDYTSNLQTCAAHSSSCDLDCVTNSIGSNQTTCNDLQSQVCTAMSECNCTGCKTDMLTYYSCLHNCTELQCEPSSCTTETDAAVDCTLYQAPNCVQCIVKIEEDIEPLTSCSSYSAQMCAGFEWCNCEPCTESLEKYFTCAYAENGCQVECSTPNTTSSTIPTWSPVDTLLPTNIQTSIPTLFPTTSVTPTVIPNKRAVPTLLPEPMLPQPMITTPTPTFVGAIQGTPTSVSGEQQGGSPSSKKTVMGATTGAAVAILAMIVVGMVLFSNRCRRSKDTNTSLPKLDKIQETIEPGIVHLPSSYELSAKNSCQTVIGPQENVIYFATPTRNAEREVSNTSFSAHWSFGAH